MSGPRGDLVGNCPTSTTTSSLSSTSTTSSISAPEDFLFLEPSQLLSLPSFSPYPCPSIAQFPVDLQIDQTGLVEDESGHQSTLMVSGGMHQEWWLWRNGVWEKTANTSKERW